MAAAKDESKAANEVGAAEVQAKFDEASEQGFFGEIPEQEPRESFTLQGQTKK